MHLVRSSNARDLYSRLDLRQMYTGNGYFYCDLQVWLYYKILPANGLPQAY